MYPVLCFVLQPLLCARFQELLERSCDVKEFVRVPYEDAVRRGGSLNREAELELTRNVGGPVFVTDWPAHMKPFYSRTHLVNGVQKVRTR